MKLADLAHKVYTYYVREIKLSTITTIVKYIFYLIRTSLQTNKKQVTIKSFGKFKIIKATRTYFRAKGVKIYRPSKKTVRLILLPRKGKKNEKNRNGG